MLFVNFKAYGSYVTDSLYQWDINQTLNIVGLNLTTAPEVHFANANMERAIVRQSTRNKDTITVIIPNSLLQEPLPIKAYIGVYEGETFKVIESIKIPVIPKERPTDYKFEDDGGDIYSYNEILNKINPNEIEYLKTRITPIELGGTGATTKEEALVTLGIDKYQRAWNVDGYVGAISPSAELSCPCDVIDLEKVFEATLPIYMKNSGSLYISFNAVAGNNTHTSYVPKDYEVSVYINDVLIKNYTSADFTYQQAGVYKLDVSRLLLTVEKGDVVTFKLKAKRGHKDYASVFKATIEKLEANVETPYTYLSLNEGTDEITVADILNALTGGVE